MFYHLWVNALWINCKKIVVFLDKAAYFGYNGGYIAMDEIDKGRRYFV
jgi:hypothetical protein